MYYKRLSLITVCFDRWDDFERSWPRRSTQTYPSVEHVVVVGGKDEKRARALLDDERFCGRIVLVKNTATYRPSYLRNLGAAAATGEYLGFVDADMLLRKEWASWCMLQLVTRYDIVIHELSLAGADVGGQNGTLAIARWLFEKIRGYNANLDERWGYEDTDLIVRAQRAGGRIAGYPKGAVHHLEHDDIVRMKHFAVEHRPRRGKVYIQQMWICRLDEHVHPWEANRVKRTLFADGVVAHLERECHETSK